VQVDDDGVARCRGGAAVVVPTRPAVAPGRAVTWRRLQPPLGLLGQRFSAQQIRCARRFGAAEPRAPGARRASDDTHQEHRNDSSLHARRAGGVPRELDRRDISAIRHASISSRSRPASLPATS